MDNNETFRERLLQDEVLQRRLHRRQRDVVIDITVKTKQEESQSLTQTERRKEEGKTAMK